MRGAETWRARVNLPESLLRQAAERRATDVAKLPTLNFAKAVPGPRAAIQALIRQAAQAPLLHSDDTPMKVLSQMAERATTEAGGVKPAVKAINTSGIVAFLEPHKVVLFFTGHDHAGKNMAHVLAHRAEELQPPMQMCDALASNIAGEFAAILCNCLTHGRRQVVGVVEHFPESAGHVIEVLAKVHEHDAACRKDQLSPEQRLAFHTSSTARRSWTACSAG
jgi:transposase